MQNLGHIAGGTTPIDDDPFSPVRDSDVTSEHRAWMNEQVASTLEKKARGEMGYTALDKVRQKFGLNAR